MKIERIRKKVKVGKYIISFTHTEKMRLRKIEAQDIEEAIYEGRIIEPYPDDPRGASCLILGDNCHDIVDSKNSHNIVESHICNKVVC